MVRIDPFLSKGDRMPQEGQARIIPGMQFLPRFTVILPLLAGFTGCAEAFCTKTPGTLSEQGTLRLPERRQSSILGLRPCKNHTP